MKVLLPISVGLLGERAPAEPAAEQDCRVVRQGERIELQSPLWVFRLDAAAGLRAKSFENRLTGRSLLMGDGSELDLDIGSLGGPLKTPKWQVTELPAAVSAAAGEAVFTLVANEPAITARVTYRWNATEPVLRKFVVITNSGEREVMLLNLRLGTYRTPAKLVEREQGFPIYLDEEFFMSVAHPAGWATGKESEVSLRQYPGTKLAPAQAFTAMETVYGVSKAGEARKSFVAHLRSRMRRVVRKHDYPYAIFDNFGSWSLKIDGFVENTERNELYSLNRLAESL